MTDLKLNPTTLTEPGSQEPDTTVRGGAPAGSGPLVFLCAVSFMVIMDSQIVLLALPSIKSSLGFTGDGAQWVLSAYLLAFGGLLLLGGRAGDLLGRRRVLVTGIALFAVTSALCGAASSSAVLVVARVAQGVSAALMAPTALSLLVNAYPQGAARNKALAVWGAVGGVGATGALLIGGGLTTGLGWEWIFWINVPVCVVLLALARKVLDESRSDDGSRSLDVTGAITLTAGMVAIIYAVVDAPNAGWGSVQTLGVLSAGVLLLCAFVVTERRAERPLLQLSLLHSRVLTGGNLVMTFIGMAAWGSGLVTSTYAQDVLHYSPLEFGLATVAMTAMAIAGARIGQVLLPRFGGRVAIAGGVSALAGCALLTGISPSGSYWIELFPGLVLFGLGLGMGTMVASVAAMTGVESEHFGIASGVNTAAFQVGGALGSAIVATVLVETASSASSPTDPLAAGMVACVVFSALAIGAAFLQGRPVGQEA